MHAHVRCSLHANLPLPAWPVLLQRQAATQARVTLAVISLPPSRAGMVTQDGVLACQGDRADQFNTCAVQTARSPRRGRTRVGHRLPGHSGTSRSPGTQQSEQLCNCRAQARLRDALAIELGMGYMEPERLWQPVRHCLAYVLLLSGQAQTAAEARRSRSSDPVHAPWK